MTRNDIIRMAREAGMAYRARIEEFNTPLMDGVHCEDLERFATLVAAAERERIIAANAPEIEKINAYIKALEDALPSYVVATIRARGN